MGKKPKGGAGGSTFSAMDQIIMQQEMVNRQIQFDEQKRGRPAVEAASKMPAVATGDVRNMVPATSKGPDIPGVKVPGLAPGISGIPALIGLRAISTAPDINKGKKTPGVIRSPRLPPPSRMPTRDKESFFEAKKLMAKEASQRQGRASTILSR